MLRPAKVRASNPAAGHRADARSSATPAFLRPTGVRAVGSFLPQLTRKAFARFGFATAALLTDWPAIVGPELARATAPERLKWPRRPALEDEGAGAAQNRGRQGATLILRVEGARALEVQYAAAQIIERINAYFGHAAVAHLRLLQAPLAQALEARTGGGARRVASPAGDASSAPAASERAQTLRRELEAIPDAALRGALLRLGQAIGAAPSHGDLP
jgi:hypothetical protein